MSARYAIYFSPPHGSPWWKFGAHWLGRDECFDFDLAQPAFDGISADTLRAWTDVPSRYGFHATLKAPFQLKQDSSLPNLQARLHALAQTLEPVELGPMQAQQLGNFVALVPMYPPKALEALATQCVTQLDAMRAPLSDQDVKRRNPEKLDARGLELLHQYGYPYVLEKFRMHFTLTGPITAWEGDAVCAAVQDQVAELNEKCPLVLDRLCLFLEPKQGQPFVRFVDSMLGI
jgi:putative phosphonate metabolism protein